MSLKSITPVILTFNEEPNIERTLSPLTWAEQIVVVDSGSTDATISIVEQYDNCVLFTRPFDSFAEQWNFALSQVSSPWALCLDADCISSQDFIQEISDLSLDDNVDGYAAPFIYCVFGKPLRASLLPPRTVLVPRTQRFENDGHFQVPLRQGSIRTLHNPLLHDDRKAFKRWAFDQARHAELEAKKILEEPYSNLNLQDKIRSWIFVAPFLVPLVCLFAKGAIFDGFPGLYYSFQRMIAELFLSCKLIEVRFHQDSR